MNGRLLSVYELQVLVVLIVQEMERELLLIRILAKYLAVFRKLRGGIKEPLRRLVIAVKGYKRLHWDIIGDSWMRGKDTDICS